MLSAVPPLCTNRDRQKSDKAAACSLVTATMVHFCRRRQNSMKTSLQHLRAYCGELCFHALRTTPVAVCAVLDRFPLRNLECRDSAVSIAGNVLLHFPLGCRTHKMHHISELTATDRTTYNVYETCNNHMISHD